LLYLLRTEGSFEELPEAADAYVDEADGALVCLNEHGEIITRYGKHAVMAFSQRPFPPLLDEAGDAQTLP